MRVAIVAITSLLAVTLVAGSTPRKLLVAHRGASAYAPEHTLAAYQLALDQGADFVEQDLAATRDGVLICLHDPTLERTTDVEQVFPDRFRETNGRRQWFVSDFTLDEIKRLDAGIWFGSPFAGARVPTFQEAIDLVRGKAGLFPELKAPELYRGRGMDMEPLVVAALKHNTLDRGDDARTPVILQSFDATALQNLARHLPSVNRTFLLDPRGADRWTTDAGLEEIAAFATGLGPSKLLIERDATLVARAHAAGLTVIPYTFRSSATGRFPSVRDEMRHYLAVLGVDGLFTDNPDEFPR